MFATAYAAHLIFKQRSNVPGYAALFGSMVLSAAVEAESLNMSRQQWFRIRKAALGYDVP